MRRKSVASALLLLACAGQSLDVGNDSSGLNDGVQLGSGGTGGNLSSTGGTSSLGTGGTGGSSLPEWPAQSGCQTDPAYQDLLGTWQGQLEDFYLQRLKSLTLVINGASSMGMCGSLKWGDGEPPPPATDPSAPYPSPNIYDVMGYGGSPGYTPLDGFTYTIAQGAVRDRTVRLSIGTRELWQSWCALQPSYHYNGGWNCVPDSDSGYSWGPDPGGTCMAGNRSFSNFTCFVCLANVCACEEQGCRAAGAEGDFAIALTLSEDRKVLTGPADDNATGGYVEMGAAYYFEHLP
jgi:hypothetical protein